MLTQTKFVSVIVVLLFLLTLAAISQPAKLRLQGSVVAYKTSSSFSGSSILGVTNILIVRVSRVLSGSEQSEHILLRFMSENEGVPAHFVENNRFEFDLERSSYCDIKLWRLMEFTMRNENGELGETFPNLQIVPKVDRKSLPVSRILPCYFPVSHKKVMSSV